MYNEVNSVPRKYRDKMFLSAEDLMEIFGCGKNWVYDYLKNCEDFTVVKIGKRYLVNSVSFFEWYYGREAA